MQEKQSIAVFVDYDNIEIGVKSTLRRDFDVSLVLDAFKERGDIVAKFAYANWSRQESATREMAENAVQMVQRIPSPRGDKNGADINLALDALEMAFTHEHVTAFAIISGDSDFIPLVNKLKEFGKTVYVLGGKAFTSTILQQNCHEFISYESLIDDKSQKSGDRHDERHEERHEEQRHEERHDRPRGDQRHQQHRSLKRAPLDIAQAMPLVERALQVLERRGVQPQLGLLKSTMLQLDSSFSEKAYGAPSFSDFVDKLKKADFVNVGGSEGRYMITRKTAPIEVRMPRPDEALPLLRDLLETHRLEMENGALADDLLSWVVAERPEFDTKQYGFQEFAELLNYAQDKGLVRVEPDEEKGLLVYLGSEFYPPALPERAPEPEPEVEEDEPQPIVKGQPTAVPVPEEEAKPKRKRTRKAAAPPKKTAARKPRQQRAPRARKRNEPSPFVGDLGGGEAPPY